MMRESLYTAGYLGVAPLLKAKLTGHSAFEGTPGAALVVSGVSAGILATLTSHPADTIKTRMQVGRVPGEGTGRVALEGLEGGLS